MVQHTEIWGNTQKILMRRLDMDSYERYIRDIVPLELDRDASSLRLGVMNDFVEGWLDANYRDIIQEALKEVTGEQHVVLFEAGHEAAPATTASPDTMIPEAPAPTPPKSKSASKSKKGDDDGYQYRPDFTFDTFVEGSNNRICFAAAQAVCKKPGRAYNPLFIHGGSGLGKTHLLQAIANDFYCRRKRPKVQYLTSEEFLNLYVEALQNKTLPSFRRHFRSLDMLLIDDVQFFAGKVGLTEEFFHTFNTLHNAHKQIIMACDRPPREIAGLEERLVSRFEWGLSSEILPPEDFAVRIAILHKKQEQYGTPFPDDVLSFIAENIRSNIRTLESALKKLVMHASAFNEPITVELASQLLSDKFDSHSARQLSIESIQKRVSEHFDIRVGDMTSKKRPANIAVPRMVAMYLSRELTGKSLPVIGEAFNRNHATVINAVKTIERKMKADESLRSSVAVLTRQLRT